MAYVEPDTKIKLCKNVPLDVDYNNTIWFESRVEQLRYFNEVTKYTLENHTFQRVNRGRLRIQIIADNLLDCNYMAFQNAQFGNGRWFYAFITSVEYVNNVTSEITYIIDEFQTWQFDALGHRGIILGNCFVEREHVNDDTEGLHTVAENLELGEYITALEQQFPRFGNEGLEPSIGVYLLPREEGALETQIVNHVPTPLNAMGFTYSSTDLEYFNEIMNYYKDKPERVALLTVVPDCCVGPNNSLDGSSTTWTIERKRPFRFKGKDHTVRNNKLYTYPYCFFTIDNFNGQSEIYRWEDFNTPSSSEGYEKGKAKFNVRATVNPRPCMETYPTYYKGATTNQSYGIIFDDFPSIPFNIDTYKIWASQATPKALISVGSTVATTAIGVGVGLATGNVAVAGLSAIGGLTALQQYNQNVRANTSSYQNNISAIGGISTGAVNTASEVGNYMVDREFHKIHSSSLGGTIGASGCNMNEYRIGFRAICHSIRPEFADIIDAFFTRYGYRVNAQKVPNTTGREYFNYVKTRDCVVLGDLPSDTRRIIATCFNKGITLWHVTNIGEVSYEYGNDIVK